MFKRILKKDLIRNKVINTVLFLFLLLAAFLTTEAAAILTSLGGAMEQLITAADSADFAQMHTGAIVENEITAFAEHTNAIKKQQTVALLNLSGASLFFGSNTESEAESILENALVVQNKQFDYLLDLNNDQIEVTRGEIAVPVYHMQQYNLKTGDTVRIASGDYNKEFVITAFLRDSLMNPSMITSKRLLVCEEDWLEVQEHTGDLEYLIELQAADGSDPGDLQHLYEEAGMPAQGTAITASLVRLINAMSDGLSVSILILAAILILLITMLCLKFIITASIEEDYREIGAMKALGIPLKRIQRLYMTKYAALSLAACMTGWIAGILARDLFLENISLYMGQAATGLSLYLITGLSTGIIVLFILLFTKRMLRRFRTISAAEAVRSGDRGSHTSGKRLRGLPKISASFINLGYGLHEVRRKWRSYSILSIVLIIATFLMIVPVNILNTMQSPEFISYMGAPECDIRFDLNQGNISDHAANIEQLLTDDDDAESFSVMTTYSYKVKDPEGLWEGIKIETGDFTLFPLEYKAGSAPAGDSEIALSELQADDLGVKLNETLTISFGQRSEAFTVCGIYQDVTNGGKTAKAIIEVPDQAEPLWSSVYINLKDEVQKESKISQYRSSFGHVKVTDMDYYASQTLGSVIDQLDQAVWLAAGLALIISILITALFFRMLMAAESESIAIMQKLGFGRSDIRKQYITRGLLVAVIGMLLGTTGAGLLGGRIAGLVITGVTDMQFIVNPWISYLLCPAALAAAVILTIICTSNTSKQRIGDSL